MNRFLKKLLGKSKERKEFLTNIKKTVLGQKKTTVRKKLTIETDIDSFLDFVKKRGAVTLEETIDRIRTDSEILRNWIGLLEEKGVIIMEYPLFKPPVLRFLKDLEASKSTISYYEKDKRLPINGGI